MEAFFIRLRVLRQEFSDPYRGSCRKGDLLLACCILRLFKVHVLGEFDPKLGPDSNDRICGRCVHVVSFLLSCELHC